MATTFPTTVDTNTTLYLQTNGISTTLVGGIDSIVTTINVVDTTNFPSVGYFVVDTEIIKYTGKTGTSFTGCVRGSDSSTAGPHNSTSIAAAYIVADHHNALKDAIIAIEQNLSDRFGLGATAVAIPSSVSLTVGCKPVFNLNMTVKGGVDNIASITFGSDAGGYSVSNSTTKRGQLGLPHYTTSQADVCVMACLSTNTDNIIDIGGGSTTLTAATQILFSVAATNTSLAGGSLALQIFSSKNVTCYGDFNINGSASPNFYVTSTSGSGVQIRMLASGTSAGYIQTNTSHPLIFTTNNSTAALTIATDLTVYLGSGGTNNAVINTLKFPTDAAAVRYAGVQGYRVGDAATIELRFFTMSGDSAGILERLRIGADGVITMTTGSNKTTHNYKATIANGATAALTSLVVAGSINTIIVMCQSETKWSGIFQCRMGGTPSIIKIGGGAQFDVSTSALTGTTGVNGNITVSSQTSAIQIENRSGGSADFYVQVFSGG